MIGNIILSSSRRFFFKQLFVVAVFGEFVLYLLIVFDHIQFLKSHFFLFVSIQSNSIKCKVIWTARKEWGGVICKWMQ